MIENLAVISRNVLPNYKFKVIDITGRELSSHAVGYLHATNPITGIKSKFQIEITSPGTEIDLDFFISAAWIRIYDSIKTIWCSGSDLKSEDMIRLIEYFGQKEIFGKIHYHKTFLEKFRKK